MWRTETERSRKTAQKMMGALSFGPAFSAKPRTPLLFEHNSSFFLPRLTKSIKKNLFLAPVARLLGPAIFEASKRMLFLFYAREKQQPWKLSRRRASASTTHISKMKIVYSDSESSCWASSYAIMLLLVFILFCNFDIN
ncbi:protein STAY-GREEN 1, chloroplastic-like [Jatropha curcas]|uniref:protein STAY-GREEN 1, chloroplastic-like n=1 Tax=Jatropha curcas TaxID=180498 RepID=UPI0009D68856|nr:protein STAY-GREEN 1, chloroplastic-like [Jatropha curcas]